MPLHGWTEHVPEQVTLEMPSWIRGSDEFSIRSHWFSGKKILLGGNNSTRLGNGGIFCWRLSALPFRSLPVFYRGWDSLLHSAIQSFYYRFFLFYSVAVHLHKAEQNLATLQGFCKFYFKKFVDNLKVPSTNQVFEKFSKFFIVASSNSHSTFVGVKVVIMGTLLFRWQFRF